MAYVTKMLSSAPTNEQARKMIDFLEYDLGWQVYDEISSTAKVFKLQKGNYCPAYLYMYVSTNLMFELYLYWDLGTHTGDYKAYSTASQIGANNLVIYCHGNEYWCVFGASAAYYASYSNPNYAPMNGDIPFTFDTAVTRLTASGIAGGNVTISVEDSSDFYASVKYQLIGTPDSKCRRMVEVNSIPSSTSMTLTNLPVTVSSGSYIGAVPCKAFTRSDSTEVERVFGFTTPLVDDAVTGENYRMLFYNTILASNVDPDQRQNVWFLTRSSLYDTAGAIIGYFGSDLLDPGSAATGDLLCIPAGNGFINSSVSSGTLTTLTDDIKSWGVNDHQGNYAVIIDGPGLGEVKKIISNTAITLTICSLSTGDLAGELFIAGYGKETNGLDVDIVDNGVESGDSASASYVGDRAIEVEIDSGVTTQSTIATALEGMTCIKYVTEDNPADTWSTASGINTVTISGGDGGFWETMPTVLSSYAIYAEAWRDFGYYAIKEEG